MKKPIGKYNGKDVYGFDLQEVEVKSLNDKEIEIIGSTSARDRDDEVLDINGWDIKNYKKNPVVLPAHNYGKPAIAKATSVKIKDGKLTFKIEFPDEGINPEADIYRKLYKSGFMKASSVGFVPVTYKYGNGKDEPYRTFEKQELLELSLVSVPANPEALMTEKGISEAVAKGAITHDEIEILKGSVSKDEENEFPKTDDDDVPPVTEKPSDEETKALKEEVAALRSKLEQLEGDVSKRVNQAIADYFEKRKQDLILSGNEDSSDRSDGKISEKDIVNTVKEIFKL